MGKFFKIAHGMTEGSMVKDINPSCPHHGAKGKVVKAYPHKITFIVANKGDKYKPGDTLTKTIDQMEKTAWSSMDSGKKVTIGDKNYVVEHSSKPLKGGAKPHPKENYWFKLHETRKDGKIQWDKPVHKGKYIQYAMSNETRSSKRSGDKRSIISRTGSALGKGFKKLVTKKEENVKVGNLQQGYAGMASPASVSNIAAQNNKPINLPKQQPVTNPSIKQQQPQTPLPAPPEGNSQGQKMSPQGPKGKYMNKTAIAVWNKDYKGPEKTIKGKEGYSKAKSVADKKFGKKTSLVKNMWISKEMKKSASDKFKPHMMYHGKKSKMAETYKEHLSLKEKGWGHTKTASVEYRGHTFPGYNKPMKSWRPEKKKVVLAKKGDQVKVVHFGAAGYGHNYSDAARKSYLARSAKIKGTDDKFSANHWARKVLWAGKGGSTKSSPKSVKGKY